MRYRSLVSNDNGLMMQYLSHFLRSRMSTFREYLHTNFILKLLLTQSFYFLQGSQLSNDGYSYNRLLFPRAVEVAASTTTTPASHCIISQTLCDKLNIAIGFIHMKLH